MQCPNCGEDAARIRPRNVVYGHGDDLFVITGVPAISCRACGQEFYDAQTLHALEAIKRNRVQFATKKLVDVAPFAADAEAQVEAEHARPRAA